MNNKEELKKLQETKNKIEKLKIKIKDAKKLNIKNNIIKGSKIAARTGQLIAPYVVSAGIVVGGFAAGDILPYTEHKQYLNTETTLDSNGKTSYVTQYDKFAFENDGDRISYYGKWKLEDNGFYSRNVEVYSMNKINEEQIMDILNNPNKFSTLQDIFGEPISKQTEYEEKISENDMKKNAYIKVVKYSESDDNYIYIKKSLMEDSALAMIMLLLITLIECLIIVFRIYNSFDYKQIISEIKEKYPSIDIGIMKKELAEKQKEYKKALN